MRIWTCDDGLPIDEDIPLMVTEAYFPDIDEPILPFMALFNRDKWDMDVNREIREIPSMRSKQIRCEYACSNRTIVNPREYCDKFIYFETRQVVEGMDEEERQKTIGRGSEEDIYCWVTHLPDNVLAPVPSFTDRMERYYGFRKFGYCKDLPGGRGPSKGVYYIDMFQIDPKVATFMLKICRPFVYNTMRDFRNALGEYTTKNKM